jgi:hypothetical protein
MASQTPPNTVRVEMRPDTLHQVHGDYVQLPLRQPVFLNSVPKSGSHLLRNILRMFVPADQQYHAQFIQWANLREHRHAFDPSRNMLSWGHLFFSDASAIETAPTRRILLVRDPYDWVIARARFFISEEFRGNLEYLRGGALSIEALLNLMIFGIHGKAPGIYDIYINNAAAWLGTGVHLVRYEDIVQHLKVLETDEADAFFAALLDATGINRPDDWRARVAAGADRRHSATARENLSGTPALTLPEQLPQMQRNLVEVAIPGVRKLLGYA